MYLHPTFRATVTELNFTKLVLTGQHVLLNTLIEFHENSTSRLVNEISLQNEDGLRVSRSGPDSVKPLRYRKCILVVLYKQINSSAIWVVYNLF